jgi:oligosaccharide 4-alpha-D-glucosyltransferase
MKSQFLLLISLILQSHSGFSQENSTWPLVKKNNSGTWKFETFENGIVKTSFTPTLNPIYEQVSNAVLLKPIKTTNNPTKVICNSNNQIITYSFLQKKLRMTGYFDSASYRGFRFELSEKEKITGTGERALPLNRRGYHLMLYNNPWYGYGLNADNLNYSVPFLMSSDGYGIFFDNPSKAYFDIGKKNENMLEYGATYGKLEFYIIPGKNAEEILEKYQGLTGTQPIPPRWALGNLMSRFGYRNQEQVMNTVKKMKDAHFPVDAVILDLFWFGDSIKGTMGNLDWTNRKAWPEPDSMVSNLNKKGIETILITEPFILKSTPNYELSQKYHAVDSAGKPYLLTDFYFGNGGLLDIFKKETQEWFWSKYKTQIKKGVAGWWGDLGEPEKHPADLYHNLKDLGFNRRFKAEEVHNVYGHYWDKMLFDKYASEYPNTRLFNLNRSGFAGSPRYGVFPWSGDVSRSWEGLQAQLPLMLGMSMSGVPYIHADAGGFAGGDGDKELYTRWLQFATFTPVFRPHGTALGDLEKGVSDIPSEAALYDEPYKSIVRNTIKLRYQLLPYNYTLAYNQAKNGKALVRPLFYQNSIDSNLYKTDNEFMWGESMLVAPVLEKGQKEKKIYLPAGEWYKWHTDEKTMGAQWINESLSLEYIPVFVKEGSFIPIFQPQKDVENTKDYTGNSLTIKYYPSSHKSEYTFFDDDGKSANSLKNGNYELIHFEGMHNQKNIRIRIYKGNGKILQPRKLLLKLPEGFAMKTAMVNKKMEVVRNNSLTITYDGKPLTLDISLK